jgi:hypothetical protein
MLTVGVAVKTGLDKPAVRFVAGVLVEPRASALPTGSILLVDPCRGRLPRGGRACSTGSIFLDGLRRRRMHGPAAGPRVVVSGARPA